MTDSSPTARAIARTANASLKLVSSSTALLSLSQLLAMQSELRGTLATVNGQIQAELSGTSSMNIPRRLSTHPRFIDDHKVVIDLSDWDSVSDGEKEDEPKETNVAGGELLA
jgi:hypothetical protein